MSSQDRKFLAGDDRLPTKHYTLEDAVNQYVPEDGDVEEFVKMMATEMKASSASILHFAENYFYIINVDDGRKTIELYDCQKKVIQSLVDNRFSAIVASRQVGKTTMVTIFALWEAIFKKDQNIFILANKEDTAKMILERVKLAYEELPNWLKSGIVEFSKTRIKFANGSTISTSTTSIAGIRGQAANTIILDEFAFVRPEIAHQFYEAVAPTISSSRTAKVIMLSTPNGTTGKFYDIYSKAQSVGTKEWNGWTASKIMWDEIPRWNQQGKLDFEGFKREQIALLGGDMNSWYQEFCCVFLDSGAAVLNAEMLERLKSRCRLPLHVFEDGDYVVWEDYKKGHIYTIGVDTAEGVGLDYSIAQILDITDLTDIRQVGQYSSNLIQPYIFAEMLNRIARAWGRPYMAIESNGPGGQVIDALYYTHKYDNIIEYKKGKDKEGRQELGILCHTNSKYTGIMNMKYWVEHLGCVSIPDINTIKEYETFRRKENGTWSAQDGFYDDRIMSMVWALIPLELKIAERYFSILQLDDVGKPKIIKDPNEDYEEMYGKAWGDDGMGTASSQDPSFMVLGANPQELQITQQVNDVTDLGVKGWTIL